MGTRNLTCVFQDGEYKVAQYGQWDGYPEGQGVNILDFLNKRMSRELFEKKVSEVTQITEKELQDLWVEAGANPEDEYVSCDIADRFNKLHPEHSRNTGSGILDIIQDSNKPLKLNNSIDFASDSLFCEWAYIIDLDKNTFEVYEGFNTEPLKEGERFYNFAILEHKINTAYYPIKHVITFNLDNLPNKEDFLSNFKSDEEE